MSASVIPFPIDRCRPAEPAVAGWDSTAPAPNPETDPSQHSGRLSLAEVRAILAPARAAIEHARRTKS